MTMGAVALGGSERLVPVLWAQLDTTALADRLRPPERRHKSTIGRGRRAYPARAFDAAARSSLGVTSPVPYPPVSTPAAPKEARMKPEEYFAQLRAHIKAKGEAT